MNNVDLEYIVNHPVFFERNRVYRIYQGGKLFSDFFGDEPIDDNYPEEWIASSTRALNDQNIKQIKEGVSKVKGTELYFDELLKQRKKEMIGTRNDFGVLIKMIDSSIRLPVQAHPDKLFSKRYFSSNYGKTESWIILGTRENAEIFYGFKDKITKADFLKAIKESEEDKNRMPSLLNRIKPKKGDVFFIPSKMVHAVGKGCLILEVQEPTDFTIQPESWCGDYRLTEYEKYLGLHPKKAIECFDFSVFGQKALNIGRKHPKTIYKNENLLTEALIDSEDTDCFSIFRHYLQSKGEIQDIKTPSIWIVIEGTGLLKKGKYSQKISMGDYFFLPNAVHHQCSISSQDSIALIESRLPDNDD